MVVWVSKNRTSNSPLVRHEAHSQKDTHSTSPSVPGHCARSVGGLDDPRMIARLRVEPQDLIFPHPIRWTRLPMGESGGFRIPTFQKRFYLMLLKHTATDWVWTQRGLAEGLTNMATKLS